jgi:hypothetical protein
MKVRYGHVSNSSTSSFIIVGKESLEASNLPNDSYIRLTDAQIWQVEQEVDDFKWNKKDQVFLTQFLSDCTSIWDYLYGLHNQYGEYETNKEPTTCFDVYKYADGSWGGPYGDGEGYINLNGLPRGEGIWIRKEETE